MSSPVSQAFRKNGRDFLHEPAGNEDLDSGNQFSEPQTATPSREYFSHILCHGRHELTAELPLTPSGHSRVIGYLPRTICNAASPLDGRATTLVMASLPLQNASIGDYVRETLPQRRSVSVSSIVSNASPSLKPRFDLDKHGQALQRLETYGSLKSVPSSQHVGDTINRPSMSSSESRWAFSVEDHAAGLPYSLHQQPGSSIETTDQELMVDFPPSSIQYPPNTVSRSRMIDPGDFPESVNLPETEGMASLQKAPPCSTWSLPCTSTRVTQQALHSSQVPPKPHQATPLGSSNMKSFASDASPDLLSQNPTPERSSENDIFGKMVRNFGPGVRGGQQYENVSPYNMKSGRQNWSLIGEANLHTACQVDTIVQSPKFKDIDEYTWSPPPSDDGQEAPPLPPASAPHHAPSDALRVSSLFGLTSDFHGGSTWSVSQSKQDISSLSGSSGSVSIIDGPLPRIDFLVPVGKNDLDSRSQFLSSSQHISSAGSRRSSSILISYSGMIMNGISSRPMSVTELKEEVLHLPENRGKTGLSSLISRVQSSQEDCGTSSGHIREEHERDSPIEPFPLDQAWNLSTDPGPGSSQTSSSLSTDRYGGCLSGCKVLSGVPLSRARCPTPPLLFGKKAISEPARSNATFRHALGGTVGIFDQYSRITRPKKTSRLPTALCSLGEENWETGSAEIGAHTQEVDSITFGSKISSSLGDNSDSENLSLAHATLSPFRRFTAGPMLQHPAPPRCNYSFMLLKNSQTGDLVQVPHYASPLSLPKDNASAQLASRIHADSIYQHPSPLRAEHNHPFTSSPPIINSARPSSATSDRDNCAAVQQDHLNSHSSSCGLSESVQEAKEKPSRHLFYKTTQDVLQLPFLATNQDQQEKEPSNQSSAWLSTVSEVTSSEPPLPQKGDLLKLKFWDGRGYKDGSLEQTGNLEVGSSLADSSTPGANFSRSSETLARSLIQVSDISPSLVRIHGKEVVQKDLVLSRQHRLPNFHKSLEGLFGRQDSLTSISITDFHPQSSSAYEPRLQNRSPQNCSSHQHISSSERYSGLMASPSAQKASAPNLSPSDGQGLHITSSTLLPRNLFLHSDEDGPQYNFSQQHSIERRGRYPETDSASTDDPTTPSSTDTRPFVQNGVVHTDAAPPILYHPVYGCDRPWDHIRPGPLRPRPRLDLLGRPLLQRPIARAESPHLHRIPHLPTPELLERHILLSRVYLIPSMVIPPIALVYGHGYMDGIMRLHTADEINGFRSTEKTIALCWGYGLSALCIFAIVIAMIIISASA